MKRRDLLALLGGAVTAWPLSAGAQKPVYVVGWLGAAALEPKGRNVPAFRGGLSELGFIDGDNIKIEYRWAEGRYGDLPGMAADLVSRKVDVILASGGSITGLAAKKATTTIPIVFASVGADPIKVGLVTNLNRPEANVTGNTISSNELSAKKLEILHGLVPGKVIALLVNPDGPTAESVARDTQQAAQTLGRRIIVIGARNESEIDKAWMSAIEEGASGMVIAPDGYFGGKRHQLAALAARYKLPTIYEGSIYARDGGFISYGADVAEGHRQAGIYVGRILKGAKPGDLPVLQPTKFDLVINMRAAKDLGIEIPKELLIQATELVE